MYNKRVIIAIVVIAVLLIAGLIVFHYVLKSQVAAVPAKLPSIAATIGGQQFNLEVASTMAEQTKGLSGRASLGADDGMLFVFGMPSIQFFWMPDMNFPIDLIWLRGDTIIGFQPDMQTPAELGSTSTATLPIFASPGLVDRVIELNQGEIAELGLKVGDTVQLNLGTS